MLLNLEEGDAIPPLYIYRERDVETVTLDHSHETPQATPLGEGETVVRWGIHWVRLKGT